jgi:hypothetical protein
MSKIWNYNSKNLLPSMFTFDWRSRSIDVYKRLIHRDRSKAVTIS